MNINKPQVSILCTSFNHEKYVSAFIDSVLAQTNPNWQLIIVDDCSTDNNVAVMRKYNDPRIHIIQQPYNMGVNCALNVAFEHSVADIISIWSSDDIMLPDYIDTIVQTMNANQDKDVIFCELQAIDDKGNFIKDFILHNTTKPRYEALQELFMNDNCFLSPAMAARRNIYKKLYPLPIPISQHEDYKTNIDLLLLSDFVVIDKILALYRTGNANSLSYRSHKSKMHIVLETAITMDSFLKISDINTLHMIFGDKLEPFGKITKDFMPFVLGMLALRYCATDAQRQWGYNVVAEFIKDQKNYEKLRRLYGFCYKDFLNLADNFPVPTDAVKYHKYKKLFNNVILLLIVSVIANIVLLMI